MKKDNIVIPLVVLVVMLISAFIPLLPMLLMTVNGGLFYFLSVNSDNTIRTIDLGLALISILFLIKSNSTSAKVLWTFFVVFFFLPVTRYISDSLLGQDLEYISLFLDAIIIAFPLFIIGLFKVIKFKATRID